MITNNLNDNFNITEELKKLPNRPGVYIMHDKNDTIIYVGKAVNLHNRVRSYFRENIGRGPKIDKMVSLISRFEYIVTDSELEALVLENNLIKEHRPKYNTMLMDDKTYPYIKVTVDELFPRVMFSRQMKKDKCKYFGPYTSAAAVKDAVDLVNKTIGLRTCNGQGKQFIPVSKGGKKTGSFRACLYYHIGQCCAPCLEKVDEKEYGEKVKQALDMLSGNYGSVLKDLKEKMMKASEDMNYEEAIKYRDLINSVQSVAEKQKIEDHDQEDKDILGFASDKENFIVQIFFVRNGRMIGREHYMIRVGADDNDEETEITEDGYIIRDFLMQFYGGTPVIPRDIMIPVNIPDVDIIEKWLSEKRGGRVHIVTPKIGQKEKLVELACDNAKILLEKDKEKIKREEARTTGAVRELEDLLNVASIQRMEAFDISNTNGFENVASMVVYENGKPKKSNYRKFKIKTVTGPDDYGCMKEVLTRRFKEYLEPTENKGFDRLPDLLLMDGGRGQVNIAEQVLSELGIDVMVCGMVKDDHHRTRGLFYKNKELPIDTHSESFKLITRVQDEAHRFAIEYHRSLRTKAQTHSVLDDIKGIGPSRRLQLMKSFSSIEDIKNASVEELMEKASVPENVAKDIYLYFHKDKN